MIVLDTHIWVNWILCGEVALSPSVNLAMKSEGILAVSDISCFEVLLLVKRGKLELPLPVDEWLSEALSNSGVESLPITCEISKRAVALPDIHRDPADRIIIATAIVHDAKLVSMDPMFPNYVDLHGRLIGK
ncbi:MAG: type II toxin-antitoxin system VapC family toxin [Gammaproteobacteria bacterium]|nr:type II toxin-antitoxin system VapC family toxin [Gammaproteobacteria bacterium]